MQNTIKTPRLFIENKFAFLTKATIVSIGLYFIFFATSVFAAPAERSLQLTGSDYDYVSIADVEQVGLDITGDMTIALWVKPSDIDGNVPLISKWSQAEKTQYILFLEAGDVGIHLNSDTSGYGYSTFRAAHSQNANDWFHVAMVYRAASSTTELFVNGQSVGIGYNAPSSISNTDAAFSIGGREDRATAFKGKIDDVRVWSRALPNNKINNLYSNSVSFNNGPLLQGFWKFNGNLHDKSINKNNLNFSFSPDSPLNI